MLLGGLVALFEAAAGKYTMRSDGGGRVWKRGGKRLTMEEGRVQSCFHSFGDIYPLLYTWDSVSDPEILYPERGTA